MHSKIWWYVVILDCARYRILDINRYVALCGTCNSCRFSCRELSFCRPPPSGTSASLVAIVRMCGYQFGILVFVAWSACACGGMGGRCLPYILLGGGEKSPRSNSEKTAVQSPAAVASLFWESMHYWTLENPILAFPAIRGERLPVDSKTVFASLAPLCWGPQLVCAGLVCLIDEVSHLVGILSGTTRTSCCIVQVCHSSLEQDTQSGLRSGRTHAGAP